MTDFGKRISSVNQLAKLTVKTWAVSVAPAEFCGPPICILLMWVFKLPKLLNTQLHSVQIYVGPFMTLKNKKEKTMFHN